MITTSYIIASVLNAALVAMLALAYYEMIRPGKILGWFSAWLWRVHGRMEVSTAKYKVFAALTHTLRGECFACLSGQLGLVYYLLFINVPTSAIELANMAFFIAPCIMLTYPLNKLFQWQ